MLNTKQSNEHLTTTVMEKGKNARTATPMGKPSGTSRTNTGLRDVDSNDQQRDESIEEKYMDNADDTSENVDARHKNRNVDKGRDQQGKETRSR